MSRETLVERVADSGAVPLHIVTASDGNRRDGCLVAFATQASMKPARMLVCLSTANLTYRIALSTSLLAVHLVPADRHDLAVLFGGRTGDDTDRQIAGVFPNSVETDSTAATTCRRRVLDRLRNRPSHGPELAAPAPCQPSRRHRWHSAEPSLTRCHAQSWWSGQELGVVRPRSARASCWSC